MKRAAIATIGNELLQGQILNANCQYIANQVQGFAMDIALAISLPDEIDAIANRLKPLFDEVDALLITGGLGPTLDDVTTEAIAKAAGLPLVQDEIELEKLKQKLSEKNLALNQYNLKQIFFPQGAAPLDNHLGTAPGFYLNLNGCHLFCLPGVPSEMKAIFQTQFIKTLEELCGRVAQKELIIKTINFSESGLTAQIVSSRIVQGYFWSSIPSAEGVSIKIRLKDFNAPENEVVRLKKAFSELLGDAIYGYDNQTLQETVKQLAVSRRFTIACAESCTGGFLGKTLTDMPGSSAFFLGGVVAYSDEIKTKLLHVRSETLELYGAVSEQCARTMAQRCQELFKADFAVSITGIAGPSGGSTEKPVGTVCFSLITKDKIITSYKRLFAGSREDIREKSVYHAMNYLRLAMMNHSVC
jgi:nicotinamide-nucleotide amidase